MYARDNRAKVFLSHSHKDKVLAEGLVSYFTNKGFSLYIDWKDSSMPHTPDRSTADKIKQKINGSDFVFVLATQNALNSKWVPWEIGIADKSKLSVQILIIPVTDAPHTFEGNEYMQLYQHIEVASNGEFIIPLGNGEWHIPLNKWMKTIASNIPTS
jgi:hypothetical protein